MQRQVAYGDVYDFEPKGTRTFGGVSKHNGTFKATSPSPMGRVRISVVHSADSAAEDLVCGGSGMLLNERFLGACDAAVGRHDVESQEGSMWSWEGTRTGWCEVLRFHRSVCMY